MIHSQPRLRAKVWKEHFATLRRLNLILFVLPLVVGLMFSTSYGDTPSNFPSFRHVDPTTSGNSPAVSGQVSVFADDDFAPWSFKAADGTLQGISIELVTAACKEAGLDCSIAAKPFSELVPALRKGEVQLVVSGLRPDAALLSEFRVSKPYFRSLGRFVVREGSSLATPDIRTLAGKRLGFVSNTSHARFVESYFSRSALTPFATAVEMQDALRTGQIDVAFGDAMQWAFWLNGTDARSCCAFLGKAFIHRETFSRSLVFVGTKDKGTVIDALDAALDQLDSKAVTAAIFSRYLPSSIW
jgi:polar amino acid transport system substrate-binding protein